MYPCRGNQIILLKVNYLNGEKSFRVPFALRKSISPVLQFEWIEIPIEIETKYFGPILDKRLVWQSNLKATRKKLNSKLHLFRPILKSYISFNNEITI